MYYHGSHAFGELWDRYKVAFSESTGYVLMGLIADVFPTPLQRKPRLVWPGRAKGFWNNVSDS